MESPGLSRNLAGGPGRAGSFERLVKIIFFINLAFPGEESAVEKRAQTTTTLSCESGGWFLIPKSLVFETSRVLAPAFGRKVTTTTVWTCRRTYIRVEPDMTCFTVQKVAGRFRLAFYGVSSRSRIARRRRTF